MGYYRDVTTNDENKMTTLVTKMTTLATSSLSNLVNRVSMCRHSVPNLSSSHENRWSDGTQSYVSRQTPFMTDYSLLYKTLIIFYLSVCRVSRIYVPLFLTKSFSLFSFVLHKELLECFDFSLYVEVRQDRPVEIWRCRISKPKVSQC